MITRTLLRPALVAVAILAGGCSRPPAPQLALEPCHLDGVAQEVRCAAHEVPEDRTAPGGRTLKIQVAVLPALRRGAAPDPLVILAGGPGQGARSYAGLVNTAFARIRRSRDIVLVDLRGTGGSNPLNCPTDSTDLRHLIGDATAALAPQACLAALGTDVRLYTTDASVADLADVLAALGYGRVNIWGGSFGTRTALVFARTYPDRLRSLVLDGAAPFDLRYPLWTAADAQRALDRLLDDCEREDSCRTRFPELRTDLVSLLRALDAQPATVAVQHPVTGERQMVRIDRDTLASALRVFLYTPAHARLVPAIVSAAAQGRFEPLVALTLEGYAWSIDTMALGLTLSVVCSEDVPRIVASDIDAAVQGSFLGRGAVDGWTRLCEQWPRGPRPRVEETMPMNAPALILSGAMDPVTPPRWGDAMARHFSRSRHVVVPGAAHNASFTGCVPDLIEAFIAAGEPQGVDASCVHGTRRPPFVAALPGASVRKRP